VTRTEALKIAEDLVTKLAPATNARGYAEGVAPLSQRVDAILRLAEYLAPTAPSTPKDDDE
jgi:hypothetical protein